MSGDVQPRKRKDKKRKKDDVGEQHLPPQLHNLKENDDLNIHVHKDSGTGGGICAKIVFFILFSALTVLIGLIITEHRGQTDIDTVDTESRFSQLFEGFVDKGPSHDEHDDEYHVHSIEDEDEHDEKDTEEHDSHSKEEEEEEEEEEEDEHSEALDEEDEGTEEEEDEKEKDVEDEEEEKEEEEEEEEEEEDEGEQQLSQEEESNEVDYSSPYKVKASEEDDDDDKQEESEEPQDDNDDDDENKEDDDQDESKEQPTDELNEPREVDENDDDNDEDHEQNEESSSNNVKVAVKIGVGVALLIVAYVVLIRKWKSATPSTEATIKKEEQPSPNLSRRNTIVVPPAFQEIQQDIEDTVEEEYIDDENDDGSDNERTSPLESVKAEYQQLRTTYTRSLTPTRDSHRIQYDDDDEEEEVDDDEEVEEEEEEEEEEEYEDEQEVDDEVDDGEEDDDDDIEESGEDEDEDLLKRLEHKYGKLKHSDEDFSTWRRVDDDNDDVNDESGSDREAYDYENITNKDDLKIKEKIDRAEKYTKENAAYAIKLFDYILQSNPSSPRCFYGKGKALDLLADQKKSNKLLQEAIDNYEKVINSIDVPDVLFKLAAERCINRIRFLGQYNKAINIHHKLIQRFPNDPEHLNQLAVTYLTINRIEKARSIFKSVLTKFPNNGFALVHYGFILKTTDNNLKEAVHYLNKGIKSQADGVIDGRFYFHLGDALTRLGRKAEANEVYEDGVKHNLFLSKYQRSLYNVKRLKAQPWWSKDETPYSELYKALEDNWQQIRNEGLSVLNKNDEFQNESENLKDKGDWKQFELFARGQKNIKNCQKCPLTCKIIENYKEAKNCRRGQTKFSVIHPGTHVWPHCGPTNCRLRIHLGLKIPSNTFIKVANKIKSWEEGKLLIFDDSFEHEVWHNGSEFRMVLIVDVWHPELTPTERRNLTPI